ncbi:MAG: SIMPL domain-containing protein [Gaiellaceae bacterium]
MRRLATIISSLLALAAVAAVTRAGEAPAAAGDLENGITVQGMASVAAVPDRATLWIGVESQGETARAALAANAAEMRRVLAALRDAGATRLQTQSVNLSPRYGDSGASNGDINGYAVNNGVTLTVKQLARAGAVIDAAVAAGANQISGPTLTHGDTSGLYRRALAAAVEDARAKAQALAAAANVSLGRVTAVVEGGSVPSPLPLAAAKAEDSISSTPIEPGENELAATVSVTFSIT